MTVQTHFSAVLVAAAFLLLVIALGYGAQTAIIAQDAPPEPAGCAVALETFYTEATESCLGSPDGMFCNAGSPPVVQPAGPVANSLAPVGALVEVEVADSVRTTPFTAEGTTGGLMWMHAPDVGMDAILLGDMQILDVTPDGFPAWQSLLVVTSENPSPCGVAPMNGFVVQNSVSGQAAQIVINGASLNLRGTVVIQTTANETVFSAIEGEMQVVALGQTEGMVAGQQVRVPHAPDDYLRPTGRPLPPLPFEPWRVANLPIELLDRPTLLPQPGYVSTQGTVNMRTAPNLGAPLIFEVPPGQIMTVLGRNPEGNWYHVRLVTGQTGWMFADLLAQNHGAIEAVYQQTPVPPQRFGRLGTTARVIAPTGGTVRSAPYVTFPGTFTFPLGEEVNLLARSPYSPWVKVESQGVEGWMALVTLETQAIIQSLPVDFSVPPPPEPTAIPGLGGNAFPDPSCYPNCAPP